MEQQAICTFLEWDSDFFGCRVARANINYLNPQSAESINQWCEREKIDCLYFLANFDDDCTMRTAEENRYHLVDLRVTFERQVPKERIAKSEGNPLIVRHFTPEDIPSLRAIARVSYTSTRFYFDTNFPRPLCDRLYETWIEKSCTGGYADTVLVAEFQGAPVGFITCKMVGENGEIGLVGVNGDRQGMGLGGELLSASINWFFDSGAKQIRVVTQGRNTKAQRLYERSGFVTRSVQVWYHRWFSQPY